MNRLLPVIFLLGLSAKAQQLTLYFATNADVPTPSSEVLFSKWLKENRDAIIKRISAHTDTVGKQEYNRLLSIRRAKYVTEELFANGMLKNFEMNTPGETEYRSGTNSENRKVVITYTKPELPEGELSSSIRQAKIGDKIILKNINFVGGTAFIVKESFPFLKQLLATMRNNPKLKIDIQGHICCEADDIGNLSEKRAIEIYHYLNNNGIDMKRMSVHGYGSHRAIHPLPELNNEEMAENRRVEIEILDK